MRVVSLLLLAALVPLGDRVQALLGRDPASQGARAYRAGRYEEAAEAYRAALADGETPVEQYGLGTALLRLERWDAARASLERAASSPEAVGDATLRLRAHYNAGNADLEPVFRGTAAPDERDARLRRAIAHYRAALSAVPSDLEAKWNLELAQRLLARQGGGGGGGGQNEGGGGGENGQDEAPEEGGKQEGPSANEGTSQGLSKQQADQILAGAERTESRVQRRELRRGHGEVRAVRDW